jgi:hypothetical protein
MSLARLPAPQVSAIVRFMSSHSYAADRARTQLSAPALLAAGLLLLRPARR